MESTFDLAAVQAEIDRRGWSVRQASRELSYDHAYLSRVLRGVQAPSRNMRSALESLLSPSPTEGDGDYRSRFSALLVHDRLHGGDHVASAGLQVWRSAQWDLDRTVEPPAGQVSAVAEMAEVAGWLCYSAGRLEEARSAFTESLTLARHSRDRGLVWFATDMLSMVALARGRPGEAFRLAEESLELTASVPGRVAVMAQVRRARALASAGEHRSAMEAMTRAVGGIEDSLSDRDPEWAWWITPIEVGGHHGEVLLELGHAERAAEHFRRCARDMGELEGSVRGELSYHLSTTHALAAAGSWRECSEELESVAPLMRQVTSGMVRARSAKVLSLIRRTGPDWLVDESREALTPA